MKEQIQAAVQAAVTSWLEKRGAAPLQTQALAVPRDRQHGDYSTTVALAAAKAAGCTARDAATELAADLNDQLKGVATCEVAGPGFINFRLSGDSGRMVFDNLLALGDDIGRSTIGKGVRVNVEYVSANPTGPLTVGHGRNAAIGDIVANLFAATGHEVTREYYFNDAGNQMNVLARSVRTRYRQLLGLADELGEQDYQGEYIVEIAKAVQRDHGASLKDTDNLDVFKTYAVAAMLASIKATLERMGVKHDVYYNEHSLYADGKVDETLRLLRAKDLLYDKDGAVWLKTTTFGADKDRVLVKSTGEATYRLPDIAYHMTKFARGFDRMVDLFGADHQDEYKDVLSCLGALGLDAAKVTVLIYQFVTVVRNGEAVKMSTRKANYITLDELMDEVGVDASRYFFVMRRLGSHLEFDLELAKKQSLDNPIYYVQYAHARICSIFRHAAEGKPQLIAAGVPTPGAIDASKLIEPEEKELIAWLARSMDIIARSAETCEPHRLTDYLEKIAELLHSYYNKHQVVVEDETLAAARLALMLVTKRVLSNGLKILGVRAPEKM